MSELEPVVFVVDDDEIVRNTIDQIIESVNIKAKKCASAQQFLDSYDPTQHGCLVLDVRMPGMSGIQLQVKLKEQDIHIPIIFITGHGDVPMAVSAVKNGAVDFIEKPFRNQVLLDQIQVALAKDKRMRKIRNIRKAAEDKMNLLTAREQQVLDLVKQGKPNKVIAGLLGVCQRTVEGHRASIMEKLEVRSLAELITFVNKIRLTEYV